jgi:large subunit ribosomal protein L13e
VNAIKSTVIKRNGKQRYGKGFSREELKKTGLSVKEALKLSVPVDLRRRTVHEKNVESVKDLLKNRKTEPKSRKKKGKSKS